MDTLRTAKVSKNNVQWSLINVCFPHRNNMDVQPCFKFNVKGHACALSHRHIMPRNLMRGFCLSMFDIHMSSYCLEAFRSMRFHVYTLEPLHDILRVYHMGMHMPYIMNMLAGLWQGTTFQIPIGDCTGVHLQCVVIWNPKTLSLSLSLSLLCKHIICSLNQTLKRIQK